MYVFSRIKRKSLKRVYLRDGEKYSMTSDGRSVFWRLLDRSILFHSRVGTGISFVSLGRGEREDGKVLDD